MTAKNVSRHICCAALLLQLCPAVYAVSVPATPPSPPAESPSNILPENQNAAGAFKGVIPPSGLAQYDWQAELVFFDDTFSGLPAFAVSGQKGRSGFMLIYFDSELPNIKKEGVFLRSAGVPVKRVTQTTLINGVSSASFTTDLVSRFESRTRSLTSFYYRRLYENEYVRAGFLLGIPLVRHDYRFKCVLDNGSEFSRSGEAYGIGVAPGLVASFSSEAVLNKGLVGSLYLIYGRLWFEGSGGGVGGALRDRLDDLRFGFSIGWHFNFY